MKATIKSIRLENFKGVKDKTFDFGGFPIRTYMALNDLKRQLVGLAKLINDHPHLLGIVEIAAP